MTEVTSSKTAALVRAAARAAKAPAFAEHRAVLEAADVDVSRLPFATKRTFRADFRSLITGQPASRLHCTSGSTGSPAFVLYSREEIEAITERAAETMRMAGVEAGQTVLNLFGYGTFIAGNLYDWGATRLGALVVPFGSASMTPPAFGEEVIRSLAPAVVNGVPSYLARYLGGLREAGCPGLDHIRIVQCAGEILTDGLRARLAATLHPDAQIFDQYGMTEFGPLAAECSEHDGMHLLEHGLYAEVLADADLGPAELVVTSLENRAMALFRYRTGDRVDIDDSPCACGRTSRRLRVRHRTDDLTKIRGVLCSKQEMLDAVRSVEGIDQFKITIFQDGELVDRLRVTVSVAAETRGLDVEDVVRRELEGRARLRPDRIEIVQQVEVPRTVSGKPRYVVDERHDEERLKAS